MGHAEMRARGSAMPVDEHGHPPSFGALSVESIRLSLIETETMSCTACWRIGAGGEVADAVGTGAEGFFGTAMATIVHLNRTPADETVTRRLEPSRWGFAWRIDERRVAVADVFYELPHAEQSALDSVLVREICAEHLARLQMAPTADVHDTSSDPALGVESAWLAWLHGDSAETARPTSGFAPLAEAAATSEANGVDLVLPDLVAPDEAAAQPRPAAASRQRDRAHVVLWRVAGWLAAVYLIVGALGYAWYTRGEVGAEAERLRALADTTLLQRLGQQLERGDEGAAQRELDAFANVRHFGSAVVTNARGRVVARAGSVEGAVLGSTVPGDLVGTAVIAEVETATRDVVGRLYRWSAAGAREAGPGWGWMLAGLLVPLLVAGGLAWRRERRAPAPALAA